MTEWTAERLMERARGRASQRAWAQIVEAIDDLSDEDPEAFEAALDPLETALERWPDALRVAPEHWWEMVQEDTLPWGWELVRTLTCQEGEEIDHGEAMEMITRLDLSSLAMTPGANPLTAESLLDYDSLEFIDISNLGVSSLDVLSCLDTLVEVVAYECHRLSDLSLLEGDLKISNFFLSPLRPEHLDSLGRSTTLCSLEVGYGECTENLTAFSSQSPLQTLILDRVSGLRNLQGLENLSALESLTITDAPDLEQAEALASCVALRDLIIGGRSLEKLSAIKGLPALESLTVGAAPALTSLECPPSLKKLSITGVPAAAWIGSLKGTQLETLYVKNSDDLTRLPGDVLKGLKRLTLLSPALVSLEGVALMQGLEQLTVESATALQDISALAGLPDLRRVSLVGCRSLLDLEALTRLPALESVDLRRGAEERDEAPLDRLAGVSVRR